MSWSSGWLEIHETRETHESRRQVAVAYSEHNGQSIVAGALPYPLIFACRVNLDGEK